jgi:hypothetical protein
MRILSLCSMTAIAAALAFAAPAHAGGLSATGTAVGYAHVHLQDANDPSLVSWGGRSAKSATVGVSPGAGVIVFFNGHYPRDITPDDIVVVATADGTGENAHAVANAVVVTANSQQIVVGVNPFVSNTGAAVTQGDVYVTVFAGIPPN